MTDTKSYRDDPTGSHPAITPRPAVVLTCCDCGDTREPSIEDFTAGRTGCADPDCGGWTSWARLVDPAAGRSSRKDE